MSRTQNIRRFRTNPVEVAIFSIVTLIFFHSLYNLFYDHQGFHPTALVPMTSNPISEGRSLASVPSLSLLNVEVRCSKRLDQNTLASKIRLNGPICGLDAATSGAKLVKTEITNTANHFSATVFADTGAGQFSTDYIPLGTGPNLIHMEFKYLDGKSYSQDFKVNRN